MSFSKGSMWMSETPFSTASVSRPLMNFTTGAESTSACSVDMETSSSASLHDLDVLLAELLEEVADLVSSTSPP